MTRRLELKGCNKSCKMWNVGVLIIFVLTVLNVLLMLRLLHTGCTKIYLKPLKFSFTSSSPKLFGEHDTKLKDPNTSIPLIFDVDPRLGRWDAQRRYKMMDHALVGAEYLRLSNEYLVCLATQTSVEKLHSLVQVTMHWSGPISLAIFVVGDEEYAVVKEYVNFIRECFPKIKNQVSFHLAFHKQMVPSSSPPQMKISDWECRKPMAVLQGLLGQRSKDINRWHLTNPYPQNHMRNLARKNCQTAQVFLTDMDIIPSAGAAENLNEFFKTAAVCSKCAYVVPTYEVTTGATFPKDKPQLVAMARSGLARPFHQKIFLHNSFATNHSVWEANTELEPVHVSHNVTHLKFYYEPFYVSSDTVPPHDERFIGYGLTKNTQVYEMVVAGYKFFVLSPIFTVHWGLQNEIKRPWWRERQTNYNFRKLYNFKKEIYARYNYKPSKSPEAEANTSIIPETTGASFSPPDPKKDSTQSEGIDVDNKASTNYIDSLGH